MVKVQVVQGWLQGEELPLVTSDGRYYSFKGIPYAQPPVGELRFQEPKPPNKWDGVRSAKAHGPVCFQKNILTGKVVDGGSEDCLYLNVYSPDLASSEPLAVMVLIHGGGFLSGSGNSDMYGPDFLVKDGVILVTMNYRLGILGFLCLDIPEVPGNAGLKDQVAALKWVHQNIAQFGGDPNNVTVLGDSVGSACAALHALSPISRNLFQKTIIMSDSPFCDTQIPFCAQKRALLFGKQLGFFSKTPKDIYKFLKHLPADEMLDSHACILGIEENMNFLKMVHLVPVVEKDFGQNAFLLEDPMQILLSGNINVSHVMAGYTADEAVAGLSMYGDSLLANYEKYPELFVPRSILYGTPPSKVLSLAESIVNHYFTGKPINNKDLIMYLNDANFKYHIVKLLRMFKNNKAKCYFYNFSGYAERNIFGNQMEKFDIAGVAHFDDLMYLFNSTIHNLPPLIKGGKSYKIIRNLCSLFTNFAKNGDPTPDSLLEVTWPQYDDRELYLDIGEDLVVRKENSEDMKFWDDIYQRSEQPYGSYT